jgi:hypothetical protein
MPSTLHCVLLFPEYRLFLALADGNSIQTRFQASKRLLTGGTRLENGPRVQGLSKQFRRYGQVQSYVRPTDAVHMTAGPDGVR